MAENEGKDGSKSKPQTGCPKCGASSGDDWSQCKGFCPIPASPHYTFSTEVTYGS